jgi:hypothetical protein
MPDSRRLLELALKGLEAERAQLDDEIIQIKTQLGLSKGQSLSVPRKRRTMSAAARKRISEGMKRRYAEMNKALRKAA